MTHCSTRPVLAVAVAFGLVLPWSAGAQPDDATGADTTVDAAALYNTGAAVIENSRDVELQAGAQTLGWPLAGRLQPETFWLSASGVTLTGLGMARRDNNDGSGRLAARIGRPVTLLRGADDTAGDSREGRLVGVEGDAVLVQVDGRIERLTDGSSWRIAWPADTGADTGGLQLDVEAEAAGTQTLTATYQVDGPRWQASHTGRFDAEAGELALTTMAVIDNSGGARLSADRAWLVAGEVNRAGNGGPQPMMMARSEAKADTAVGPQSSGDTYRYALDGGIDVPAGATRAVAIMAPQTFEASRRYRLENSLYSVTREAERRHAAVRLRFDNTADVPLPAGALRVYNGQQAAGLLGEDAISDTPTGAPVNLTLGAAFDITAERRLVDDARADGDERSRTVEITLHNAGDTPATVDVVERLPDTAGIESASEDRVDDGSANSAQWTLEVPAGGDKRLRYTATWTE